MFRFVLTPASKLPITENVRLEHMSFVTRKPVFGVSDQLRLKPAFSADETSEGLEISAIASRNIILSRREKQRCDQTAPLLFAYGKRRFCHDMAHIMLKLIFAYFRDFLIVRGDKT